MLTRRIIPCLDVRDGRVVKGVRFRDHVDMGDIVELARHYRDDGADELVFYDIRASPEGRRVDVAWVERVARELDIPFCVAGGIRRVADARAVLHAGADKVSVNSPALARPELIDELAAAFGVQCVVVGIDSLRDADGEWRVRQYSGDPARTRSDAATHAGLDRRGAAARRRRDRAQLHGQRWRARGLRHRAIARGARHLPVPLVASGGAGTQAHFVERLSRHRRRRRAGGKRLPRRHHRHSRTETDAGAGRHRGAAVTIAIDFDPDRLDWDKGDGLLPAVVQHAHDGRVLMLGYMNARLR